MTDITERYTEDYPYITEQERSRRVTRGALIGAVAGIVVSEIANVVSGGSLIPHGQENLIFDAGCLIASAPVGVTINVALGTHAGRIAMETE